MARRTPSGQVAAAIVLDPTRLRRRLLGWYDRHKRPLPWRDQPDPYRVWISEIMLQQTQVETVKPYFDRFIEAFPTLPSLAGADPDRLMKLWEGLGYYSRARHLQKAACRVLQEHDGLLPRDPEALNRLPGIGRYTAGAIASIAYGVRTPVVDGNVARVLSRLLALEIPARSGAAQRVLWDTADRLVSPRRAGDFNQAIMELGARICRPARPACGVCPLQPLCSGCRQGRPTDFPLRASRREMPRITVAAGVVWNRRGDRVLISQRPNEGLLGGLWEFPGGKVEPGESPEAGLTRELEEELGIGIRIGPKLMEVHHAYSHRKVHLMIYHCLHESGRPRALQVARWRWSVPRELRNFAFPAANVKIIERLGDRPVSPFVNRT